MLFCIFIYFISLVIPPLSGSGLLQCPGELRPKMQNCSRDGLRDNLPGPVQHQLREGLQAGVRDAVLHCHRGGLLRLQGEWLRVQV